jgi:iron complex transport system substrate-binding protein
MWRVLLVLLLLPGAARAAEIVDATGRTVSIPDHVARILPAGPPAGVLLLALAPDLMLGYPGDLSAEQRAFLSPEAAALPKVPRLTGKEDVTEQVRALKPDLIVDYGDVTPAYIALAKKTQERLGVPTILLDGSLKKTPDVLVALGKALHRELRAEALASAARWAIQMISTTEIEHLLKGYNAQPRKPRTVMYLRGSDNWRAVASDVGASEVFKLMGWQVLAPPGTGSFRPVTQEQVASLDPDALVFGDARMRDIVASSDVWRGLRAVKERHAYIAPALPFGWVEEPPSINRLAGIEWLFSWDYKAASSIFDTLVSEATTIDAVVFGHTPTNAQLEALIESTQPLSP